MKKNRTLHSIAAISSAVILGFFVLLTGCNNGTSGPGNNTGNGNQYAEFLNGVCHITTGGRFILAGEHEGQVLVEATANDVVELVLNGLTLHNPNGSAVFAPGSQRVEVVLADGTVNTITDGSHTNDAVNAAIYIQQGLVISGKGTLKITTDGHAIRSAGAVTVNEGSLIITATGKGITANGSVLIAGGDIQVIDSDEGIEGLNVTIAGGNIDIFARDDGINARDPGGTSNPNIYIRFTGGNTHVHVEGDDVDGIDSNGDNFLEGGTLLVSGPSSRMASAIDLDGTFFVTGGSLVTAGSVQSVSPQSTQPFLSVSFSQRLPANTNIEIRNAGGSVLLHYISKSSFSASGFTSPSFVIGDTYSLFISGRKVEDITLNNIITSIGGR